MALASILVKLGLDASGYQTGLKQAESVSKKWGASVTSNLKGQLAGVFGAAAIGAAMRNVVQYAGAISDMSAKTRIAAETLQEWEYAAQMTGTSLETFVKAFQFLAKENPALGSEQLLRMFNGIADEVGSGKISNELAYVQKILGRSGGELIPAFKAGLSQMADEAQRFGAVMDNDVIRKLDDFGDRIDRLGRSSRGTLGGAMVTIGEWVNAAGLQVAKMSAGFGARLGFARAGVDPALADKLAQQIAFDQTFGAAAQAEIAGKVARFTGKPFARTTKDWMSAEAAGGATSDSLSWRLSSPSVNALQQVGAYSGAVPTLLAEAKKQTKHLAKIEKNTDPESDEVE